MSAKLNSPKRRDGSVDAVRTQHRLQAQTRAADRRVRKRGKGDNKRAVQAGVAKQPENPLPRQHQRKPGDEAQLDPAPRFLAPDYKGSERLTSYVTGTGG